MSHWAWHSLWQGNQVLLWKQPHPIFFAELDYRLHPTRTTFQKWKNIIESTADHMADYVVCDDQTGIYHLNPVMPPSEQGITRDDVFVHSAEWHDTYTKRAWEHPDPVGVLGMLPDSLMMVHGPYDGKDSCQLFEAKQNEKPLTIS